MDEDEDLTVDTAAAAAAADGNNSDGGDSFSTTSTTWTGLHWSHEKYRFFKKGETHANHLTSL